MLRTLAIAALCLLAALPAGAAQIKVFLHDLKDDFTRACAEEFEAQARANPRRHGVQVIDAGHDAERQLRLALKAMDEHPEVPIIIRPVDSTVAEMVADRSLSSSTPVIFFGRSPGHDEVDRSDGIWYVDSDAHLAGILQAQELMEAMAERPLEDLEAQGQEVGLVLLAGPHDVAHTEIRSKSFKRALNLNHVPYRMLAEVSCNWDERCGHDEAERLIRRYGKEIYAFVSNNDAMALGALAAMEEYRGALPTEVHVLGVDGLDRAVEAVAAGRMLMTVGQNKQLMVRVALELADSLTPNGKIGKTVAGIPRDENTHVFSVPMTVIDQRRAQSLLAR
ncbi:MAG: substrate-binding domain-containing protein [Succinivibrionaceae bacterium]|nr:substrate-binding domain-containing protein [Succinivibrionaceae bacterium]